MRTADFLLSLAEWLESPENEAMLLSEHDDQCMEVVATSLVQAATVIKKAAETVDKIEITPETLETSTPEALSDLATFATELDFSGDPKLMKQAAMIDDLLNIVVSNPKKFLEHKISTALKWKEIRDRGMAARAKVAEEGSAVGEVLRKVNRLDEAEKAIDESKVFDTPDGKQKRPLQAALRSRYCPDHPGESLIRVTDDEWRCPLNNKTYNYRDGFTLENGDKIPGTSMEAQTATQDPMRLQTTIFDDRQSRMSR
jgi:hypothetical protein